MFSATKQNEGGNNFPWIALNDMVQLDEILEQTAKNTVIFKHSTRCGISNSVLNRFEKKYQEQIDGMEFYLLDLLNYRTISTKIAEHFQIIHQSPQIIVIEKGKVKIYASHHEILEVEL